MSALEQLIRIGSAPLGPMPPPSEALVWLQSRGRLERQLAGVLSQRNGFFGFEGALHVFPLGRPAVTVDLESWNSLDAWRSAYGDLARSLFFAEDIFGGQFCFDGERVCAFDPETGALDPIANDLEEWAARLLLEHDVLCGSGIAHEWQAKHGALRPERRLAPKVPFVTGGEYSIENLYGADRLEAMRFRGSLAVQIRDVPDGGQIRLRTDGEDDDE